MAIPIRVYSDYVCPYCYLAEFPLKQATEGKDVAVRWMPFELRPYPHPTLRPEGEYLQQAWAQSVYPMAQRMGVPIRLPSISPQPYTHLAFEGFQYAAEQELGNEYTERVFRAFFQEGRDIGQVDVLVDVAESIGLDSQALREALQTRSYRPAHQEALQHAVSEMQITAVPTIVIGSHRIDGLASREALERAIAEA